MNKDVALRNLTEVVGCLGEAGIQSGPFFGSLLGLVREHDFIPWDEDIDMYLLEEHEQVFRSLLWDLKERGWELVRYDWRGLYSIMKEDEYIDFYVFRKVSPELRHNGGPTFVLEKYFQDTVRTDFKGVTVTIPRESEELLAFFYGDNWRTPVRFYFTPTRFSFLKMRLLKFIKGLIPPRLRPWAIRVRRRGDLEKYKQKCAHKGIRLQYPISL